MPIISHFNLITDGGSDVLNGFQQEFHVFIRDVSTSVDISELVGERPLHRCNAIVEKALCESSRIDDRHLHIFVVPVLTGRVVSSNFVSASATEHVVDRLPSDLPCDIPQGDIYGGDCACFSSCVTESVRHIEHVSPVSFDSERILAYKHWCEHFMDAPCNCPRTEECFA